MKNPKVTARTANASMASGNIAAAIASDDVQTRPTAAAISRPAAVPPIRSIARVRSRKNRAASL
jgi:hypothetical protein